MVHFQIQQHIRANMVTQQALRVLVVWLCRVEPLLVTTISELTLADSDCIQLMREGLKSYQPTVQRWSV